MRTFLCAQVLVVCLSYTAFSQTAAGPGGAVDSAEQIVQKASAAFSSLPITSVYISGTAHAIAGSLNETGNFSATVLADGHSEFQLNAASLTQSEKSGSFDDVAGCKWARTDGIDHATAEHNCWRSLNWLLPAFSLLSHQAQLKKDLRPEPGAQNGHTLALFRALSLRSVSTEVLLNRLSAVQLLTDPNTALPVSIVFSIHPDDDANLDIPITVRYSDYRRVNGVSIPYHIQKYINGGLSLDLQVENAQIE